VIKPISLLLRKLKSSTVISTCDHECARPECYRFSYDNYYIFCEIDRKLYPYITIPSVDLLLDKYCYSVASMRV